MKKFNVTGICVPEEHYAVDISEKISQIMKLIDERCYFTINRARQYGKTTTLFLLKKKLLTQQYRDKYLVVSTGQPHEKINCEQEAISDLY